MRLSSKAPLPGRHIRRSNRLAAALICGLWPVIGAAQTPSALSETYGSWTYQCRTIAASEGAAAQRDCQVSQELAQSGSGQRIMTLVMTAPPYELTLLAPFGLLLSEPIRLSAGDIALPAGRFVTCLPNVGCISKHAMAPAQLDQLRDQQMLRILMTSAEGQLMQLDVSLDGLTAAVERLERENQAPQPFQSSAD